MHLKDGMIAHKDFIARMMTNQVQSTPISVNQLRLSQPNGVDSVRQSATNYCVFRLLGSVMINIASRLVTTVERNNQKRILDLD